MRAGAAKALVGALLAGMALAAPAWAQEGPGVAGYDGSIPFECELQQAGFGTEFPDSEADPFCVEYDKSRQNVTELGLVEFLSKEPARVAIASDKCFYYQRDHWRGSIVQEDGSTKTYEWDGSYFFDKSRGVGGAYVENFNFGGQTGDPTAFPGFPDEYRPFFGDGRGGVQVTDSFRADPRCVGPEGGPEDPGAARDDVPRCADRSGRIGRGIGGLALGILREDAVRRLGPPARSRRGVSRWCLNDGGKLIGATRGGRYALVLTTSPRFRAGRVRVGQGQRSARRALRGEWTYARRGRNVTVLSVRTRAGRLLVGVRGRRVAFLALAKRDLPRRSVARYLTRTR